MNIRSLFESVYRRQYNQAIQNQGADVDTVGTQVVQTTKKKEKESNQ